MYYTSPSVTMEELEEHKLDTWRSEYPEFQQFFKYKWKMSHHPGI
jgi:hypothetical protein